MRMAAPPVVIVSDYQHFLDGWKIGLGAYTGDGSKCGEAWALFSAAADDFGLAHITVREVAAHLPYSAVFDGRITFQAWIGNRRADLEAKKGVTLHPSITQHLSTMPTSSEVGSVRCAFT